MSKGYVYVLTNESMPNLVKIGRTTRSVHQRAAELYQTGVPTPFEVYAEYICPDCTEVEMWVHDALSECRVSESREFFVCHAEKAAREVMNAHREQVEAWLDEFLPGHGVRESGMGLCPSIPSIMATHFDATAEEVVEAYAYMYPEDIAPALERQKQHMSGAKKMSWLGVAE